MGHRNFSRPLMCKSWLSYDIKTEYIFLHIQSMVCVSGISPSKNSAYQAYYSGKSLISSVNIPLIAGLLSTKKSRSGQIQGVNS